MCMHVCVHVSVYARWFNVCLDFEAEESTAACHRIRMTD